MKNIDIYDLQANKSSTLDLSKITLVSKIYQQAIFDEVLAQNAGLRQGTHSTLTKAEVRGGGKKPVAQKHTGRARQGSIRNPHYVGGGVCFGPKPTRNYSLKVNKKVASLAFDSVLSMKNNDEKIYGLVDQISADKINAKTFADFLSKMKLDNKKCLIVVNDNEELLAKKIKNIKKIIVKKATQVSTSDLLNCQYIFAQRSLLNKWINKEGAK